MATWSEFETAEREIAHAARELLSVPGFGFAYLATVAPDEPRGTFPPRYRRWRAPDAA